MQNDSFILYFNLTLIIPAIICFIRLKNIPKEYLYFFIFLFAGFLNESIYLINISTKVNTISTIVYSFIETQCLAYIFCKWRNFNLKYTRYLQIGLFFSWITGHIIQLNASEISIDWFNLVNKIVLMYIAIPVLNKTFSPNTYSQRLIIIPFVVFNVYFIIINLLMAFLFNKTTQPLFMNLYSLILIINILSYISYSLAILWAPKKEQFL